MDSGKRKTDEETELPPAKRQDVEGEEEEEEDNEEDQEEDEEEEDGDEEQGEDDDEDDDEDDEDDDEDDEEDEDEDENFRLEDFEDVEGFTAEKLDKFSAAFQEFQDQAEEKAGPNGVVLMANDPTTLRPVPMTADDFEKQMAYCFLTSVGAEAKGTIEHQVVMSLTAESDDEGEPDPDKVAASQIEAFASALRDLKANTNAKDQWEIAVVLTHMFLEDQPTNIFQSGDHVEGCSKLLTTLADIWAEILSKTDEELGFKGDARDRVKSIIKLLMDNCNKDDLASGGYKGKFDVKL